MSLRLVRPLPAGTPGDPGLTGPGSVTWRVCRPAAGPDVALPSADAGLVNDNRAGAPDPGR